MFSCAHCGNQLPDGATFCNQCWKTVEPSPLARKADDATVVAAPPADAPTFEAPAGQPSGGAEQEVPAYPAGPPPPAPSPWAAPVPPPVAPDPTTWGAPAEPDPTTTWSTPSSGDLTSGWAAPAAGDPPAWGTQPTSPAPPAQGGWGSPPPPPPQPGWAPPPPPGGYTPYGASPYGTPYGTPYYGAPTVASDGFAIASLVCSLVGFATCGLSGLLGVVFGHIALSRIKKSGAGGRGLAIAGLVIGYLMTAGLIFFVVAMIAGSNANSGY